MLGARVLNRILGNIYGTRVVIVNSHDTYAKP
jgi:hypothetical protein